MENNTSKNTRVLPINQEYIELYKVLKLENLVQSGGEAKFIISQGHVCVNNRTETRKRKKIHPGDLIEYNGCKIQIISK